MHIGIGGSSALKHEVRTAIVYDSSGSVIHTHHVVTFAGGTPMHDDQVRARALQLAEEIVAGSKKTVSGKLETILVDGRTLLPGMSYTVDTKRHELVPGQKYVMQKKTEG